MEKGKQYMIVSVIALQYKNLIVVSTDGASAMIGHENGFVSHLKKDTPKAYYSSLCSSS